MNAPQKVKLVSTDGETELSIVQNYQDEGRPGFHVSYIQENGATYTADFPISPEILVMCIKTLMEGEHNMLNALYMKLCSDIRDDKIEELDKKPASVLKFVRND